LKKSASSQVLIAFVGWSAAFVMAFPILWMGLAAFKTELDAIASPPLLFFHPTLENFGEMNERVDYIAHAWNSIVVSFGSTLVALALSAPAAYSMAFFPTEKTRGVLLWMLSTKFMPAVGVLVPIYILMSRAGLLDTKTGLILITVFSNLPIVVWMLYSFFKEVPHEILEAGRMDGAGPLYQLIFLLLPLASAGLASTALLSVILSWNESFWCINLTQVRAGTLALAVASFSNPEGFFWAKLSAASVAAIAPMILLGWATQRQLVRGLTFGAVK
jgi:sorbitol/mannitol transport system permease protein